MTFIFSVEKISWSLVDLSIFQKNYYFKKVICNNTPNLNLQIDPTRTISAGKVNMGAFRTYPKVSLLQDLYKITKTVKLFTKIFFIVKCKTND